MAFNMNMNFGMNPMMMGGMGGMGGMNPMMMGGMGRFGQGFMLGMEMAQMMQMMQMMMGSMMMGGMNPMMMGAMSGMGMGGMDPMMMGMNPMMGSGNPMMMGNCLGNYMGMSGCGGGMPYSASPFGGGSPFGGNYGGYANSTNPMNFTGTGGNGSDAVALGERFLGQNSIDVRGRLPNFTAAGGQTNNCADFVSSCLESTGKLNGHHVGVGDLEQALIKQGYHQVPASQAKPGDVWMNASRGHTELVAAAGGKQLLGSNNDRPGHQVISEKPHNPQDGVYYSRN